MKNFNRLSNIAAWLLLSLPVGVMAQAQIFAYPSAGQSEEQQSRDRFECHQWSVSQTGFNPTTAQPLPPRAAVQAPPPQQAYNQGYEQRPYGNSRRRSSGGFLGLGNGGFFEGGGAIGDAATGAALGAAGGAIAGNAGKGAAIGALSSTVFGAFSRSNSNSRSNSQNQYQQQQQQQQQYQQAQQAQQAQADQAYLERIDRTDEYNRAYGACMRSREYTIN
ncbi:MAG: hypothetical protein ACI9BW_004481 [Gammaproteobacteria bacterium]|jgi:hypothetical protein